MHRMTATLTNTQTLLSFVVMFQLIRRTPKPRVAQPIQAVVIVALSLILRCYECDKYENCVVGQEQTNFTYATASLSEARDKLAATSGEKKTRTIRFIHMYTITIIRTTTFRYIRVNSQRELGRFMGNHGNLI
jgi:hypothetical protein